MGERKKSYYFGIFAEYYVLTILLVCGYRLIARRYRTKFGEIDLLMRKNNNLVAFEVKARKSKSCEIGEVVNIYQFKRIENTLKLFLNKNEEYSNFNIRIDVALFFSVLNVKFLKNVWSEKF